MTSDSNLSSTPVDIAPDKAGIVTADDVPATAEAVAMVSQTQPWNGENAPMQAALAKLPPEYHIG